MMKRFRTLPGLVAIAALALATPSCVTRDASGNPVPDTEANAKIAASITTAVAETVTRVVRKNPQTAIYFAQVSAVFCKMQTDKVFNVAQLTSSLNLIPIPENIRPEVTTAKNLIVGLYSAWLQSKWDITLDDQKFGGLLSGIMCAGITTGIHDAGQ